MDQKQRQNKKAKEINYLGQLGEMVKPEATTERSSSMVKEYENQKKNNDSLIQDQLKKQNEKLMEKLKERQANSFNRSLNRPRKEERADEAKDRSSPKPEQNILDELASKPPAHQPQSQKPHLPPSGHLKQQDQKLPS